MANQRYTTSGILGVNFAGADTSAEPKFAPLTQVVLFGTSAGVGGGSRTALYVKCGSIVTVSSNIAINADGTASVSAGGFISMNSATTAAGDWIWVRTSAQV